MGSLLTKLYNREQNRTRRRVTWGRPTYQDSTILRTQIQTQVQATQQEILAKRQKCLTQALEKINTANETIDISSDMNELVSLFEQGQYLTYMTHAGKIIDALEKQPTLKQIKLSHYPPHSNYGLDVAKVMAQFIQSHPSLETLTLDQCSFGADGTELIASALKEENCKLKVLDLGNSDINSLSWSVFDDDGPSEKNQTSALEALQEAVNAKQGNLIVKVAGQELPYNPNKLTCK